MNRANGRRRDRRSVQTLVAAATASITVVAAAALPGDSTEGKRLHDANCTGCHDASVYTRQARSVRSLDALKQQLDTCGHATDKSLSTADKQNIVKYLNERFYKLQ